MDKKRMQKYSGRIQYLACRDDILKFIEQGLSIKMIYTEFQKNGRITISYRQFYNYVVGKSNKTLACIDFEAKVKKIDESQRLLESNALSPVQAVKLMEDKNAFF